MHAVLKLDNLENAWRVIQQNGRASNSPKVRLDLEAFAEDAQKNLRSLHWQLSRRKFRFGKARGMPIPKLDNKGQKTGKIRPIVLAPVADRIVQRALLNVLVEVEGLKCFAQTPYSFGGIRSPRRAGGQKQGSQLSAVPAAIKAVLDQVAQGAKFVATADISAFFTRIPKANVFAIIEQAIGDDLEFLAFVRDTVHVELENLAELKSVANEFPTEDIGVAQGNSLSPLLGNIVLAEFDQTLNQGDYRCIRYIDDFIILAPTQKAANARLRQAKQMLGSLGMNLSNEKSSNTAFPLNQGFEFLGISICPGLIRPANKAQARLAEAVERTLRDAEKAMIGLKNGNAFLHDQSLINVLKRLDGMLSGWRKHYWFCNDGQVFANLDAYVDQRLSKFLAAYSDVRSALDPRYRRQLLGITQLVEINREPFVYPKQ